MFIFVLYTCSFIIDWFKIRVTLGEYVLKSDVEPLPGRTYGASGIKVTSRPSNQYFVWSSRNFGRKLVFVADRGVSNTRGRSAEGIKIKLGNEKF